jgi:hypothetical protein
MGTGVREVVDGVPRRAYGGRCFGCHSSDHGRRYVDLGTPHYEDEVLEEPGYRQASGNYTDALCERCVANLAALLGFPTPRDIAETAERLEASEAHCEALAERLEVAERQLEHWRTVYGLRDVSVSRTDLEQAESALTGSDA